MKTKFKPNIAKSRGSRVSSASSVKAAEDLAGNGSSKEKERTGGSPSDPRGQQGPNGVDKDVEESVSSPSLDHMPKRVGGVSNGGAASVIPTEVDACVGSELSKVGSADPLELSAIREHGEKFKEPSGAHKGIGTRGSEEKIEENKELGESGKKSKESGKRDEESRESRGRTRVSGESGKRTKDNGESGERTMESGVSRKKPKEVEGSGKRTKEPSKSGKKPAKKKRGSVSQPDAGQDETGKGSSEEPVSRARRSGSSTGSITSEAGEETRRKRKRKSRSSSPPISAPASEGTSPSLKRPRGSGAKVREAPDRTTMTMQELIYYNPTANPMSYRLEEAEKKQKENGSKTDSASSQPATPTPKEKGGAQGGSEEREEAEEEGRLVPQLRIGEDGNIIIDEESVLVETTHQQDLPGDISEITEGSGHTTSASYRQRHKITKWNREETSKFFKALSQVGTDFTMMTLLLPRRSRKELKNKFKKEEKNSPHLISQALNNQLTRTQRT